MKKKVLPYSKSVDISSDDRGTFVPFIANTHQLDDSELPIKRVYYVYNYGRHVVRGFHFHKKEWKYFIAVCGAVKIVAIDPKDHKQIFSFTSSARKPNLIVVPPGFANGWVSLEDNTVLVCCSTATLKESIKDDTRIDPYKWGDVWQVKGR